MKQPIKMTPGDDLHLSLLMAPHSLNLAVGQLREQLLGYGRAAFEAGKAGQCLRQIQDPAAADQAAWHAGLDEDRAQAAPAAVAVPDAVRDAEKLLRAEAARLKRIYGTGTWYGFSAEKASHLEHLRVADALAATPADHVADAGKMVAAAAPVVLPEPEAAIKEVMGLVEALAFSSVDYGHKRAFIDPECEAARKEAGQAHRAVESKLRALLATGGQAQAVERGEVLVTVSGFTGSGKSAIAGEIEILCRALGLQVEWPDGDSEKNMTHADWTAALEQYKPRVHIVEQNIPFAAMKGMSK